MTQQTPGALVKEWLAGDPEGKLLYDACYGDPEMAWLVILQLAQMELTEDQVALLAAGPMENLLAQHGGAFIDRIEEEARVNARFNHLLGGVWRQEMPEAIWERVERARKGAW